MGNLLNDSIEEIVSGRDIDWRKNPWSSREAALIAITGKDRVFGMKIPCAIPGGKYIDHHFEGGLENDNFVPYDSQLNKPDGIIVAGYTLSDDKAFITLDGSKWRYNSVDYGLPNIIRYPIAPADPDGLIRIDRIKLVIPNQSAYMQGTPGVSAVAEPLTQGETLLVDISVSLDGIFDTPAPIPVTDGETVYRLVPPVSTDGKVGDVWIIKQAGPNYGDEWKKYATGWVLEYSPAPSVTTFEGLSDAPEDNLLLAAALDDKVDKVTGFGLSQESFSTAEKNKLGLLSEHFRGFHASVAALNTAWPVGSLGDYAYVDLGAGQTTKIYLWDSNDNLWRPPTGGDVVITDASESSAGIIEIATLAEALARTDDQRALTALKTIALILDEGKNFEMQFSMLNQKQYSVYMRYAGNLSAILSAGIVSLQIKKNSGGTYAVPAYPYAYAAGDRLFFQFDYVDQVEVSGNITLIGRDN